MRMGMGVSGGVCVGTSLTLGEVLREVWVGVEWGLGLHWVRVGWSWVGNG